MPTRDHSEGGREVLIGAEIGARLSPRNVHEVSFEWDYELDAPGLSLAGQYADALLVSKRRGN